MNQQGKSIKQPTVISPISDSDWTIHSLNIQGTFFERLCQKIINDHSQWKVVSTNYPVAFPRHTLVGEQSALDIYAQIEKKTILLTLLIECKKNNPEFINWVFFPHIKFTNQLKHFSGLLIANKLEDGTQNNWKTTTMLNPMISLKWTPTSDAWETRGNYQQYKDNIKTRTSNKAITDAAHQIAIATRCIFEEELDNNKILCVKTAGVEMPYVHQIFIPVIVTTANLFICKFDPKNINPEFGEIPFTKAHLERQPYVLYEYPLPVHFHSDPLDKAAVLKVKDKDFGKRMDILVVNSSNLPELLSKLADGNA